MAENELEVVVVRNRYKQGVEAENVEAEEVSAVVEEGNYNSTE